MQSTSSRQLVEKACTPFLYWMGHAANYTASLWLLSRGVWGDPVGPWKWITIFGAGLLLWTLAEYTLHRFLYHEVDTVFAVGHTMHHEDPKQLIGMPWFINVGALFGVYYLLGKWMGSASSGILCGAFWLGHISYTLVHHATHHWNSDSAWFKRIHRHHHIHHVFPRTNHGVTTQFWDRIFGTFKG